MNEKEKRLVGGGSLFGLRPMLALAAAQLALLILPAALARASCPNDPVTTTGGGLTVSNVAGFPVTGTLLTSTNALDGTYYQLTNMAPSSGTVPTVRNMFSTMVENGYNLGGGRGGGPVYYGGVFSNPTASAITVTQVNVSSLDSTSTGNFFDLVAGSTTPAAGWSRVSATTMRWTGSLSVPANSGQAFIFASQTNYSVAADTFVLFMTVTAGGTPYTGSTFTQQVPGSTQPYAADAVVGFDSASAATYAPETYEANAAYTPGAVINLSVRVRETGNNSDSRNGIEKNLILTLTIPAGWSSVSVPTAATPWDSTTVVIVQPTASTAGLVTIHTKNAANGQIDVGTSTPANTLVVRATAPSGTYVSSLFPFTFNLNGRSQDTSQLAPVTSKNESVVRVVAASALGIEADFTIASVGTFPLRQIYFEADFNMTGGTGSDTVNVDFWNYTTSSWTTLATVTPTSSNSQVVTTFLANYAQLWSSGTMKMRLISTGSTSKTLGIDYLVFVDTPGFTVNSATGNDANVGDVAHPYATLAKGLNAITANAFAINSLYVEVGNSQSGSPYPANIVLNKVSPGAGCVSLFQGVTSGGVQPLVRGTNPASDVGFELSTSYQKVDNFQFANEQVGLYVDPSNLGNITLSNNYVQVPDLGYGIILDAGSRAINVNSNQVDATGTNSFIGIWEYAPNSANTIDNNNLKGHGFDAIRSDGTNGTVFERNVTKGNWAGIHIAGAAGPVSVWNNTSDGNSYFGIYVEQSPGRTVTSRNNILRSNLYGWAWDGLGTIDSDYEDVYSNTHNYNYTVPVIAGAHSISADPSFVQTTNPALATYYQLNVGSPCVDTGTTTGIPWAGWLGAGPDIGAVESH